MKVHYHKRNYWHLEMNFVFFKCNEQRIERIFNGWHYKCIKGNKGLHLYLWNDELETVHGLKEGLEATQ